MKLTVATCQFPVSADIYKNLAYITRQIHTAKERGAQVVHFPEGALSGYASVDFASHEGFNWSLLKECTEEVLNLAGELQIWVILGSSHRLSGANKPHNSLYIINDQGELVDRYDMWISCSNSSARESCWPAFFVRPDGVKTGQLRRNVTGLLLSTVDTEKQWYDSTKAWRDRVMEGIFHSGTLVEDERSRNRTEL